MSNSAQAYSTASVTSDDGTTTTSSEWSSIANGLGGTLERFQAMTAKVLLLGGEKSQAYLKDALDGLSTVLPHARRVELAGLGHLAADNGGKPERVSQELRRFFGESFVVQDQFRSGGENVGSPKSGSRSSPFVAPWMPPGCLLDVLAPWHAFAYARNAATRKFLAPERKTPMGLSSQILSAARRVYFSPRVQQFRARKRLNKIERITPDW